jgi:hypothetical protein
MGRCWIFGVRCRSGSRTIAATGCDGKPHLLFHSKEGVFLHGKGCPQRRSSPLLVQRVVGHGVFLSLASSSLRRTSHSACDTILGSRRLIVGCFSFRLSFDLQLLVPVVRKKTLAAKSGNGCHFSSPGELRMLIRLIHQFLRPLGKTLLAW